MVEPISLWEYFGSDPTLVSCIDTRAGVVRDLKKSHTFSAESGTVYLKPDHFGRGVNFITDSNLKSSSSYAIGGGPKTMMSWCRAETGCDATYANPVSFGASTGQGLFLSYIGGTYYAYFLSGSWRTAASDRKHGLGELVFLTGRSDNTGGVITGSELFVNGVLQANRNTTGYTATVATAYTYIGTYAAASYGYNFRGWVGDCAFFDRCFTDTEIREYYERSIKDMRRYYPVSYVADGGGGLSLPVAMHHYEQQRGMM